MISLILLLVSLTDEFVLTLFKGPPVTGLVQNNISGFGSGTFGSGGLLNTSKPNTGFTG